ncbi:MAG: class I SAM-dependent methyltransferase [Coriobacteriales bacterium]|jgi:SAM-dependent methyltransferase|nr:class I SAM-dependent methyltransferase [Coriobacteriales bacterium]
MQGLVNWRFLESLSGWNASAASRQTGFWDDWASNWERRSALETEFTRAQIDALDISERDIVLDICCGTGRMSIPLAKRAKRVISLDSSHEMLELCKQKARAEDIENIDFIEADWFKIEPELDLPYCDVALACLSPASSDILKLNSAASRHCYSMSFSKAYAFYDLLADLFEGTCEEWLDRQEALRRYRLGPLSGREFDLNVSFNILYDAGINPTISYVQGSWQYEAGSSSEIVTHLARLGQVDPDREETFKANVARFLEPGSEGRIRFRAPTEMYVLGWKPLPIGAG